jgi:hypothetical protein
MGWRFRRSIKLAPGVRVNFGSSGVSSVSVGRRGARVTIGKRGVTQTLGIPGTGLSYSTNITSTSPTAHSLSTSTPLALPPASRFGLERPVAPPSANYKRFASFSIAFALLLVASLAPVASRGSYVAIGLAVFATSFVFESRSKVQAKLDEEYENAIRYEVARRLTQFHDAITTAGDNVPALRAAIAYREQLELTDKEVGYRELNELSARADLTEFVNAVESRGGALAPIEGHERIVANQACYFVAHDVLYDKRGDDDPTGSLYLTNTNAIFVAPTGSTSVPWSKTASISRDYRGLLIQRRDRQNPTEFYFEAVSDAFIAEYLARRLWASAPLTGGNKRRQLT